MEAPGAVQLILGPARSGKTHAALELYRQALAAGRGSPRSLAAHPRCLWLAPSGAAADDVRHALVADAGDAFLDPGVTTFTRLGDSILAAAAVRVRLISPWTRRCVLRRVIGEALAERALVHYGRVAGSRGFLAYVGDWIAEQARREPPPEPTGPRPPGGERRRRPSRSGDPRRGDLAELAARYHAALAAQRWVDAEGALWLAKRTLDRHEGLWPRLALVAADGFSDFTVAQAALLVTLAGRAERMAVTLLDDGSAGGGARRPRPQFARPRATAALLGESLGARPMRAPQAPAGSESLASFGALAHVERHLFANLSDLPEPAAEAVASAGRIHILAASGVQAEIDEVTRRAKALLVAGERPGDVVIAFRSTRDVADRVRRALADAGVPAWIDAPQRLGAAPVVRALAALVRLAAEDWPYRAVLAVAGNSSIRLPADSDDPDGARAAIELCVRHAQLPSGRDALVDQLAAWAGDPQRHAEPSAEVAAIAAAQLGALAAVLDGLPRRATLGAWVRALARLVERLGLADTADAQAAFETLATACYEAEQAETAGGAPAGEHTLGDVASLLAEAAAELPWSEPADAVGRVRVLSADAARHTRPRHLFLAGLSEESFAGRPARDAEGASSEARGASGDAEGASGEGRADGDGGGASPRPATGEAPVGPAADEMLRFYQLATLPTATLTLSYAALDARAQPLVPSPLLGELERTFGAAAGQLGRTRQTLGAAPAEAEVPFTRRDVRRQAVHQALERRREGLAALASHSDAGAAVLAGIDAVARRADRGGFGAFDGIVASEAARGRLAHDYGPDHLWSPSQLETYAECPFKFFGRQALRLAPAPELALASDMVRRGHLLHDALARLYAALAAAGADGGADAAAQAERLIEEFRAAVDAAARVRPGRGLEAALREIERRQVHAWAARLAQQDQEYRARSPALDEPLAPTYFEASFGPRSRRSESTADARLSTPEPFVLDVAVAGAEEPVQFGGQIDRIDVGRVGDATVFNIIDYKSGQTSVDRDAMAKGKQLQLPLYALAAAELLLRDARAAPLAGGYWSVGSSKGGFGGSRGKEPLEFHSVAGGRLEPTREWEKLRTALLERIGASIAEIRAGHFPVFNDDPKCTTWCELQTICRIAQVRSVGKKWVGGSADGTPRETRN